EKTWSQASSGPLSYRLWSPGKCIAQALSNRYNHAIVRVTRSDGCERRRGCPKMPAKAVIRPKWSSVRAENRVQGSAGRPVRGQPHWWYVHVAGEGCASTRHLIRRAVFGGILFPVAR